MRCSDVDVMITAPMLVTQCNTCRAQQADLCAHHNALCCAELKPCAPVAATLQPMPALRDDDDDKFEVRRLTRLRICFARAGTIGASLPVLQAVDTYLKYVVILVL
jgi:hypothetical protein